MESEEQQLLAKALLESRLEQERGTGSLLEPEDGAEEPAPSEQGSVSWTQVPDRRAENSLLRVEPGDLVGAFDAHRLDFSDGQYVATVLIRGECPCYTPQRPPPNKSLLDSPSIGESNGPLCGGGSGV